MDKPIYGHSLAGKPVHEWQSLEDHSMSVAEKAAAFAAPFQSENWAWNLGILHDIGKIDPGFQNYLFRCNGIDDKDYDKSGPEKVNHSSAGMGYALKNFQPVFNHTLAYIIGGHHAGLPDWENADTPFATVEGRRKEAEENLEKIENRLGFFQKNIKVLTRPNCFTKESYHFWVRMLFSCLTDADYLDTENFMQPDQAVLRGKYLSLSELKGLFDRHMDAFQKTAPDSPVNRIRNSVLTSCLSAAKSQPGLYSLTVPTGGGKTLSAMAFALAHAVAHNKSRIIYVIPYTSIIEQTAGILKGIFGNDQVIEHHSNLAPENETQRMRLASENWDAPIIVTTNVQFFESLFSAKPSRCRKLHNIVNSVVILDEAQMLPVEKLSPCLSALNALVQHYQSTILLTTATQPALSQLPQGYTNLMNKTEIISDVAALFDRLKRVEYHFPDRKEGVLESETWESLAQKLQKHDSVLCIVNSRKDCFTLYNLMPEGTYHLSALMCGQHRSEVIAEIKGKLKAGESVRVISTQLIEAGVDVDFPVVFRAIAGLDSIVQAAGRCNREGKAAKGDVFVFMPPKLSRSGLLRKAEDTTLNLLIEDLDMNTPESYNKYFPQFYHKTNDMGKAFHDMLENGVPVMKLRTVGETFQLINDAQRPVIVRYGDAHRWIDELERIGPTREIMRKLQRYTVNLPMDNVKKMLADGQLILAKTEKPSDIVLQNLIRYDARFGLDVYHQQLPVEDLII